MRLTARSASGCCSGRRLWAVWIAGRGKPDPRMFHHLRRWAPCSCAPPAARSTTMPTAASIRTSRAPRTRPLAAGRITTLEALILFAVAVAGGSDAGAAAESSSTLLWAVPGAFLAVTYPFVKRFLCGAAAVSGRRLRLGYSHGVRGAARTRPACRMAVRARQRDVGHRLRHDLRHGGSRRRPQDRRALHRHSVRRLRPAHHRRAAGDDAR